MGQRMDPTAEVTEILTALGGLLGGAATLITVLRRHADVIPPKTRGELEELQDRLERLLSEEEGGLGKHRGSSGAPAGC